MATSGTASRPDCKNDNTTQSPGVVPSDEDEELVKAAIGEATKKRAY
jgi:hypothetical protein